MTRRVPGLLFFLAIALLILASGWKRWSLSRLDPQQAFVICARNHTVGKMIDPWGTPVEGLWFEDFDVLGLAHVLISAGPNRRFETTLPPTTPFPPLGGDDLLYYSETLYPESYKSWASFRALYGGVILAYLGLACLILAIVTALSRKGRALWLSALGGVALLTLGWELAVTPRLWSYLAWANLGPDFVFMRLLAWFSPALFVGLVCWSHEALSRKGEPPAEPTSDPDAG